MTFSIVIKKTIALGILALSAAIAVAQDAPEETLPPTLTEDAANAIVARIESIDSQERVLLRLIDRADAAEGMESALYSARIDTLWAEVFNDTVTLARDLTALANKGFIVDKYIAEVTRDLNVFPEQSVAALARLRSSIDFPTGDLGPVDIAIADQRLLQSIEQIDFVYQSLITYIEVVDELGLENKADVVALAEELEEGAANRSSFLELAKKQVTLLEKAAATLPADTDVAARLAVSRARIQVASTALRNIVSLMNQMDLETSHYSRQVVTSTGELTSEVLDMGVIAALAQEWSALLTDIAKSEGPQLLFRLLIVAVILFVFWHLSGAVQALAKSALKSSKIQVTHLLSEMIISTVRNLVFLLGILIALSQIGISLGPLLAGLGIAGFIIGFALQDTLSNFASGMLILLYRPFDVGDFVTAGGVTGKVSHMSLVNTTFKTIDNQVLVVPNNMIWSGVITNITAQQLRRVDLVIGVSYGDDVEKVEKILADIIESHDLVLDNPEPMIRLHELADSSVNFVVRPWVKTDDYWDVYWDLLREIKLRFDKEGITIPFPQRQVHTAAD